MAWNKNNPANDELLINFPAQCRANWDALEALTTEALKITNAKVADNAAIADTKLAQITTAAKVSGAALTLLPNVPSGAGVLPDANSPHKLKADSGDTTPQYLDGLIDTTIFQISAGDLLQLKDAGVGTEKLVGGVASPGSSKYYGTNAGGTKGFYDFPGNADTVDNIHASTSPQANKLLALDGNSAFPASVTPSDIRLKAWINFDGTGTISIKDSYNVASIVDLGTGYYTINWDTDFANTYYCVVGMAKGNIVTLNYQDNLLVGSCNVEVNNFSAERRDWDIICVMAIGDQ